MFDQEGWVWGMEDIVSWRALIERSLRNALSLSPHISRWKKFFFSLKFARLKFLFLVNLDCRQQMLCSHSVLSDTFATPWTAAFQAPLSMGLPRQEYWSWLPFPSPGDLLDPGIELLARFICKRWKCLRALFAAFSILLNCRLPFRLILSEVSFNRF